MTKQRIFQILIVFPILAIFICLAGYATTLQEQQYLNEMKQKGYTVERDTTIPKLMSFSFIKVGDSQEGILKVTWKKKETLNVKYLRSNGRLEFLEGTYIMEKKAPIGPWRVISRTDSIPDALRADTLNTE